MANPPLYVFPDPRAAVAADLETGKPGLWPTALVTTTFPLSAIAVPHIQHAWDGTPSQEQQRQRCTVRITVWTPKGKVSDGIALAQLVLAYLLDTGSSAVWRYTSGAGPLNDTDPATGLPFCTFTVTAETRPAALS